MANTITLQHDWAKLTIDNYENTPLHTTKCFLTALEYFNALDRYHIFGRILRATHHFYEHATALPGTAVSDYGNRLGALVLDFQHFDYNRLTSDYVEMIKQIPAIACQPLKLIDDPSILTESDTHRFYFSSCKTTALYVFYDESMQISRAMLLQWPNTPIVQTLEDRTQNPIIHPITTQKEINEALALDWSPLAYEMDNRYAVSLLYQAIYRTSAHTTDTAVCAAYLDTILASVFTRMDITLAGINHQMKLPPKFSSIVPDPGGFGVQLIRTKV